MGVILKVENVSKQYRLGEVGTGTLSHDLNRWWSKIRGKEDPFLKIGETNDRTSKGSSDYVWALRDINFEVEEGQAVGIIGRNGAGKSTLLKLLSKITQPTTGEIKFKGRIASLLEVGTGFHPGMTGRENIYLNGAILGMTRKEISRKFDEIVDFAGVERYIDTPVKRYSSGMYVRLAFAVAAHLESEILIVDEVLSVGDAEFQKKCLGKMGDVTKNEGRTILFVSHNMGSIRRLCDRGILLNNGLIQSVGEIEEITNLYIKGNSNQSKRIVNFEDKNSNSISINSALIEAEGKGINDIFDITDSLILTIFYQVHKDMKGTHMSFALYKEGVLVFRSWDIDKNSSLFLIRKTGKYKTSIKLPSFLLTPGNYTVYIGAGQPNVGPICMYEDCLSFDLENVNIDGATNSFTRGGLIRADLDWSIDII